MLDLQQIYCMLLYLVNKLHDLLTQWNQRQSYLLTYILEIYRDLAFVCEVILQKGQQIYKYTWNHAYIPRQKAASPNIFRKKIQSFLTCEKVPCTNLGKVGLQDN